MTEYKNSDIEKVIAEYIHSEVDRAIIRRRLIDGICFSQLAEEFNYSDRHIMRIVYRLQAIVFKHLGDS